MARGGSIHPCRLNFHCLSVAPYAAQIPWRVPGSGARVRIVKWWTRFESACAAQSRPVMGPRVLGTAGRRPRSDINGHDSPRWSNQGGVRIESVAIQVPGISHGGPKVPCDRRRCCSVTSGSTPLPCMLGGRASSQCSRSSTPIPTCTSTSPAPVSVECCPLVVVISRTLSAALRTCGPSVAFYGASEGSLGSSVFTF